MKWNSSVNAQNLAIQKDEHYLLANLSCTLHPGELLHITGVNGVGKSTFLRTLCGLSFTNIGSISVDGKHFTNNKMPPELFHYIGHQTGVQTDLTPYDTICLWESYYCVEQTHIKRMELLSDYHLTAQAHLLNQALSSGQKKRLAFLRLQIMQRPFWFLDEIFAALDTDAINLVAKQMNKHLLQGGLIFLTSHQAIPNMISVVKTLDLMPFSIKYS